MRVEVLTDRPAERFTVGARLHREGSTSTLTIVEARPANPGWVLRFGEIPTREAAESLRLAYLEVEAGPADALPRGAYFWHEMIGVEVREASVTHLAPPDEVRASFDAVTQAQTEMRTRLYGAEQEAGRSLQAAEADGYRQKQLALAYAGEKKTLARAEADSFLKRLEGYRRMRASNPDALAAIWWDEMGRLFAGLREGGRVDLLDRHLGTDGLDITTIVPPKKK